MKILLAYDGFDHSQNALEEVARLARDGEGPTTVTVASVVPEADARATKSGGHRFLAPHAHVDVARAHEFLAAHDIESTMKVLHGDPVEELCREAEAGGYDLAVAGSHQRGAVGEFVFGSVSKKLIDQMPIPVIVAGGKTTSAGAR
jgi:nucleotide-binding universal stress UspA family protein